MMKPIVEALSSLASLASFTLFAFVLTGTLAEARMTENEIDHLIGQMTLEEKVKLIGGNDFETFPISRLQIPPLKMTDGPVGVHYELATAFPAGIAYGASFDPDLIRTMAQSIAEETRFKGRHMLLAPCVNISRNPFGGRNYESYGEDPFLTGRIAEEYIRGVQSRNVLTSVKHFAVNDQEFERMTIDVNVGYRALFEIHLPAFKRAIDAGAWSVMAAYNKINGFYATENADLINNILKGMWNYRGFVVSDWGATHSLFPSVNAGLDLEMPTGLFFNDTLVNAVRNGSVAESLIDDKVRRVLRAMAAIDLIGKPISKPLPPPVGPDSREHKNLSRRVARESAVLLKNQDAILPLKTSLKSLAVLGPNSVVMPTGGGGSSHVDPTEVISPLQGFKEFAAGRFKVVHAVGVSTDGQEVAGGIDEAVRAARSADAAVIIAGLSQDFEGEGFDRMTMDLPENQVKMINAVAEANRNTVVVLMSGNPVTMETWLPKVKGLVQFWYPGQEGGRAMADVVFGLVNPSGKLPVTFLKRWEDSPAYGNYPGKNGKVVYEEGVFVGYRHFDVHGIEPEFPFGFGLSYTTFELSNLRVKTLSARSVAPRVRVTFDVRNTGDVAGAEVPQLYVGERKPTVPRPIRELKGFEKVYLEPGETKTVTIDLAKSAFAYFDTETMKFRANKGDYYIEVGDSSRHLPLRQKVVLQ